MQVSTSLQTDNQAIAPPTTQFFTAAQPTVSKAPKALQRDRNALEQA